MQPTHHHITTTLGAVFLALISFTPVRAGTSDSKIVEAPPREPSPWSFRIEPYGWLTNLDGTAGVAGITTHIDVPFFNELLDNLDIAAALQLEARYNRWGLLLDGFYAELSVGGNPPGPLYSNATLEMKQGLAEVALAYRIFEGKWGFVDLLAGARYNYLWMDLNASLDRGGIEKVSESASERIVKGITARARERASERMAQFQAAAAADRILIENQLKAAIRGEADGSIARDIAQELRRLRHLLDDRFPPAVADRIERALIERRRALAEASAEERVAALRTSVAGLTAAARARAQGRHEEARLRVINEQKKLAKAIDRELKDRLPQGGSASKDWVDPFVGFRAQWNITRQLFLAARADIGGFSVGSDLAWQLQGTLGVNLSRQVFVEAGWRYLSTDYTDGGFTYDIASSGLFTGLGLRF